jgi:ribosomal protein L11 methyltransferase
MRYVELRATVHVADAEAAAEALRPFGAGGVVIEAPFRQADLESDATPAMGDATVRVYADAAIGARAHDARAALAAAGITATVQAQSVDEEDWAESWKRHFHPLRVGEHLVIVPTWREFTPLPGDIVLRLDPGMAFGTGQHETTRMCLEALERTVRPGARVLDAGCGSGILAVAAAKLGAAHVTALDMDDNCVRVARDNAALNGVAERVIVSARELGEPTDGEYDVIVANIIARTIIDAAEALVGALSRGGMLIVSGVIAEREADVVAALDTAGGRVIATRADGEWRCIEATRA